METFEQSLDSSQSQKFFGIFLEIFGLHLQKRGKRPIKIILKYSSDVYLYIFHILTPMTVSYIRKSISFSCRSAWNSQKLVLRKFIKRQNRGSHFQS